MAATTLTVVLPLESLNQQGYSKSAVSFRKFSSKWIRKDKKKHTLFCKYSGLNQDKISNLRHANNEISLSSSTLSSILVMQEEEEEEEEEEEDIPSSKLKIYDAVLKQVSLAEKKRHKQALNLKPEELLLGTNVVLSEAYNRCRNICAEYAKIFYLGTMLMTPVRRKAIWAIYVWCRRTDELVDGHNASHITHSDLQRWEGRLMDLFAGRPYDIFDAALYDTVSKFSIDIQPFLDMIEGMRMDLEKSRFKNFDELYLYCYHVAGTVGLMSLPVMGIAPESKAATKSIYNSALALGIANQLTNILRDVGEDANRGRIYLPQDELKQAGFTEEEILKGKVTDKWRSFMRSQIDRARMFFDEAEKGIPELSQANRWPMLASLMLYRMILDEIEENDYNNFTKRAYVSNVKKLLALPIAYGKSLASSPIR